MYLDGSANALSERPERQLLEEVIQRLQGLEMRIQEWSVEQQQRLEMALASTSVGSRRHSERFPSTESPTLSTHLRSSSHGRSGHRTETAPPLVDPEGLSLTREATNGEQSEAHSNVSGHRPRLSRGSSAVFSGHTDAVKPTWRRQNSKVSRAGSEVDRESKVDSLDRVQNPRMSTTEREDIIKHLAPPVIKEARHLRFRPSKTQPHHPSNLLGRIVAHVAFDYFFASMIVLNSVFIGVHTDLHDLAYDFFDVTEKIFICLFASEMLLRLIAEGRSFFVGEEAAWNVFDLVLVTLSVVDVLLSAAVGNTDVAATGSTVAKVVHTVHMARIIRIIRLLRFLSELRVLVNLIMRTLKQLFWLVMLLLIILYVFAILFTQGVYDAMHDGAHDPDDPDMVVLKKYFGSLLTSAQTLFGSLTGGIEWYKIMGPLSHMSIFLMLLFLFYILFGTFSILNIITGVFVDGAIQRSSQERDLKLEKQREERAMYVTMLLDLLEEIDVEGEGVISRETLEDAFQDERVKHYFSILDIDVTDSNYLFDMLDLDRSGEVDMEEFVSGCLRLKGAAKSIDIHTLMFEIKLMMTKWDGIMEKHLVSGLRPRHSVSSTTRANVHPQVL